MLYIESKEITKRKENSVYVYTQERKTTIST
jgi:hypothetical protein